MVVIWTFLFYRLFALEIETGVIITWNKMKDSKDRYSGDRCRRIRKTRLCPRQS